MFVNNKYNFYIIYNKQYMKEYSNIVCNILSDNILYEFNLVCFVFSEKYSDCYIIFYAYETTSII